MLSTQGCRGLLLLLWQKGKVEGTSKTVYAMENSLKKRWKRPMSPASDGTRRVMMIPSQQRAAVVALLITKRAALHQPAASSLPFLCWCVSFQGIAKS
jgi:hypothetical protein